MKKLGWIGLGHMGAPMAGNLLKAGFSLNVYNRTAEKANPLIEKGANLCNSPKEVIVKSDIVFFMLSNPSAIKEVLTMENGVMEGMEEGKTIIDMSTVAPDDSLDFFKIVSEKGGLFIDAPVSGSVGAAKTAQLVILLGADGEKKSLYEPFLKHLGKKIISFGGVGKGSSAKLSINLLLGVTVQGIAETLVFAGRQGIDKEKTFEAIMNSGLNTGLFTAKLDNYRKEEFPSEFMIDLMSKDLGLIKEELNKMDLEMPLAETTGKTFLEAIEKGRGKLDFTGIYQEILERNK